MALRLIEILIPASHASEFAERTPTDGIIDRWEDQLTDDRLLVRMLVNSEHAESMLDVLEDRYAWMEGFRVMLLPVEATLPRPEPKENGDSGTESKKSPERISREELYHDISETTRISPVFVTQVVLATLVAAVGLLRDDTAIIIGAMVIAPLLGPNMSLCLATCLGDLELAKRALKTNAVGLAVALVASLGIGLLLPVDRRANAIATRTEVAAGDIILALASGCAGVLAFTTGAPSALIGVMVAVALLPPFAVFGLLLAQGEFEAASGALLLVATNVICVNLAGVVTFVTQGVRPRSWWEAGRAKKATQAAIIAWSLLLLVLILLITYASV